jgi:hypothetical protein
LRIFCGKLSYRKIRKMCGGNNKFYNGFLMKSPLQNPPEITVQDIRKASIIIFPNINFHSLINHLFFRKNLCYLIGNYSILNAGRKHILWRVDLFTKEIKFYRLLGMLFWGGERIGHQISSHELFIKYPS